MLDIETVLKDECKLVKDRPIIVGVSGGPDSLCLMEILRQAGYSIIVAHFDHQLRQESSDDAKMVKEVAERLNLNCILDRADVGKYAQQNKLSIEEAARNLRYQFMFKLAHENNAQAVAVGHTADDQVETILMHFLRGSGINGLKGMSYRSIINTFDSQIPVVRPLLDMRRGETISYCELHNLNPHYDSSNDSLEFQRNRIRHELIPNLENFNPKFREAVLRMSQTLKDDHFFMTEILENAWREAVININGDFITFRFDLLSKYAAGLQRNLIKQAMQILNPNIDIDFATLNRAVGFIQNKQYSSGVDLKAGLSLFCETDFVYILNEDVKLPFNLLPQMTDDDLILFSIPNQVELAGGWKLTSERVQLSDSVREQAEGNTDPFQIWLDAESISESLNLRVRREGDRFAPLGMNGHSQKISDFFINEKIPQRAREHLPLLCVGDEIIWVPGYRPSHSHRLTNLTKDAVYFCVSASLEKSPR